MTLEYAPAALPDDVRIRYLRYGYQTDALITSFLARNRIEVGALPAIIDGDVELTWKQVVDDAARFGGFLHANGVGPGDAVLWQLPNWWQSLVAAYGVWACGAISNPVVEIYREHELRRIVETVRPKAIITAAEFRGCAHAAMLSDVCDDVGWSPDVRVVVRGTTTGWTAFDDALTARPHLATDLDSDDPALVVFTSGTTSGAKGVVHSTRSYLSYPLRTSRWAAYGWDDRSYSPMSLGHVGGLTFGVAVPLFTGGSTVLSDRWDAAAAVDAIQAHGVTYTGGAAVFAQELLAVLAARGQERLPLTKGYTCGASPFTTALAESVEAAGLQPTRAYGMTEVPTVSGTAVFDEQSIRVYSDGLVAPGCEIRVVDGDGRDLAAGEVGEFVVRGPHRALGYIEAHHTAEGFDDEGWFHSGDLGFVDERGALKVTGRLKEIINRGGEKISAREIEDVLAGAPAVLESAVVPAPHDRLGEQPAAFVLLRPGATAAPEELAAFLRSAGLPPQKIPAVWRYVDELPRTASGKVKKYELQATLEAT
jgi:acyl-CoA synthetase